MSAIKQKLEALAEREAEAYADAPQPEHNDPWYEKHADYKAGHTSTHAMLIEAVEALKDSEKILVDQLREERLWNGGMPPTMVCVVEDSLTPIMRLMLKRNRETLASIERQLEGK